MRAKTGYERVTRWQMQDLGRSQLLDWLPASSFASSEETNSEKTGELERRIQRAKCWKCVESYAGQKRERDRGCTIRREGKKIRTKKQKKGKATEKAATAVVEVAKVVTIAEEAILAFFFLPRPISVGSLAVACGRSACSFTLPHPVLVDLPQAAFSDLPLLLRTLRSR